MRHALLGMVAVVGVGLVGCGFRGQPSGWRGRGGPTPFFGQAWQGTQADPGMPCDPGAQGPCAGGLACSPALLDGGFLCQAPGELYPCQSDGGCSASLACVNGLCAQLCQTSADCFDPLTTCQSSGADGGVCGYQGCSGRSGNNLWHACDASGPDAGDGTCVPIGYNGPPGSVSACQQAGPQLLGERCQFYRQDGGAGFCGPGLMCMVDEAGDNQGLCFPACDPFEPWGPACDGQASCVPTRLPFPPPAVSSLDYASLTGVCAPSCIPASPSSDGGAGTEGDGGCPALTTCVDGSVTSTTENVCLP